MLRLPACYSRSHSDLFSSIGCVLARFAGCKPRERTEHMAAYRPCNHATLIDVFSANWTGQAVTRPRPPVAPVYKINLAVNSGLACDQCQTVFMSDVPTLETERLTLRAFRLEDAAALHEMHQHEEVMQFSGGLERFANVSSTVDYMAMHLGYWRLYGFGKWALVARDSGQLVGRVGFAPSSAVPDSGTIPELGWLLSRQHWGQGYATEAAGAALQYGFDSLKQKRIVSLIEASNKASVAVGQRLGQSPHGEIVHYGVTAIVYAVQNPN